MSERQEHRQRLNARIAYAAAIERVDAETTVTHSVLCHKAVAERDAEKGGFLCA